METTKWRYALTCIALTLTSIIAGAAGRAEPSTAQAPVEIVLLAGTMPSWSSDKISQDLGIKLTTNGIYVNDSERVQVMLAAGEFPDVGPLFNSAQEMYNQGITRSIPIDMIRTFAPNYTKIVDEQYPTGFIANQNPGNPKELLSLNGIAAQTDGAFFLPMFRKDWAQRVGVTFPDFEQTKRPLDRFGRVFYYDKDYTLEWFQRLLVALRDGDPDGNGKNDTIPLHATQSMSRWTQSPAGAFGVVWGGNREVDGVLYDYRIDPGMKEFLTVMARWYQLGLIDKELVSLDLRKGWEKIAAQRIGAAFEEGDYAGIDFAMDRPPNSFVPNDQLGNEGAEVIVLPPLIGPGGQQGTKAYRDVVPQGRYRWFINAKVDGTKFEKALALFDYSATVEGWITWHYGQPGVNFDWEGAEWASVPIPRGEIGVEGMVSNYPDITTPATLKLRQPADMASWFNEVILAPRGMGWALRSHRFDIKGETAVQKINETRGADLNTLFEEFFYRALTGEIDVQTGWDQYVAEWRASGGNELMAAMVKAPLVSGLRQGKVVY
jgi:hypothetical protein